MDHSVSPTTQACSATRAYYSARMGKGHLLVLVEHDGHTGIAASAAYCAPGDKFDPKGETEGGLKGRRVAEGRLACARKEMGLYKTKVVLAGVGAKQVHLLLPYLRHALCRLPCAPGWAKRAVQREDILFVGAWE